MLTVAVIDFVIVLLVRMSRQIGDDIFMNESAQSETALFSPCAGDKVAASGESTDTHAHLSRESIEAGGRTDIRASY